MSNAAVHRAIHRPIHRATYGYSQSLPIPSGVEVWLAGVGMYQDTGMTNPVTASGQTLAKWVGSQGTVVTGTNYKAVLDNGAMVARGDGLTGSLALPSDYSIDRRNTTVSVHCKRPGTWLSRAFFGFGAATRDLELYTSTGLLVSYDGTTAPQYALIPRASWHTATLRSNASAVKAGINGTEVSKTAVAAGTFTGGLFQNLGGAVDAATGFDFVYGFSLSTYADDAKIAAINAYWNSKKAIPSETAPKAKFVIIGDSNTEGTNTVSLTSWVNLLVNSEPNICVIPIVGAAQYFNVGGSPMNNANTSATIDREYISGVNSFLVLIVTNDFNTGGSGSAYYSAAKTLFQAKKALGWKIVLVKFPYRTAPYTTVTDTTYNSRVDDFNALLLTDAYADYVVDLATPLNGIGGMINNIDGIHWTDAAQAAIKNQFVSTVPF